MKPLETERLILRDFSGDDFEAVHAYGSDPGVVRYTTFGPNTEEETRGFLRRAMESAQIEPRTLFHFAVVRREDGRLIGGVGLDLEDGRAELGYVFQRESWGRGYATEAARAMLDFGFRTLGLHRIFAHCFEQNTPSAHVMEKLGMRLEGRLHDAARIKGAWQTLRIYAILDDEWAG